MERNSSGALRAPGAFGAKGTSDPHVTLSSCSLHIRLRLTHTCHWHGLRLLAPSGTPAPAAAFGRSTADDAASGRAGASGASSTFLSMRVCRRSAASRASPLARSGAAAFGHSSVDQLPRGLKRRTEGRSVHTSRSESPSESRVRRSAEAPTDGVCSTAEH
jgi:hypothetical protein